MLGAVVVIGGLIAAYVGFIVLSGGGEQTVSRSVDEIEPMEEDPQADGKAPEPSQGKTGTQSPVADGPGATEQDAEAVLPGRPIGELRAEAEQAVADTRKLATDLEHPALQRLYGGLQVDLDDAQSFEKTGNAARAATTYQSIIERAALLAESKSRLPELKTASVTYTQALRDANGLNGSGFEKALFDKASKDADQAADAVEHGDFPSAIKAYQAGAKALEEVVRAQRKRIDEARAEGEAALEEGDGEAATEAFSRLLSIDKNDAEARKNLDRSRIIEQLMPIIRKARAFEDQQVYDLALIEIEKALALDPGSPRAKEAEQRIKASMLDKAFEDALRAGEVAFEAKRYADAVQALRDALAVKPEHEGAKQLMERTASALMDQKVAVFLYDAAEAERARDYRKAFDLYETALVLQPGRKEAVEGRERSARGIKNANTAAELIASAEDRLTRASLEEVELAIVELQTAAKLVPDNPRPRELLKKAELALAQLNKPVSITIKSDGKTNIDFYKVGRYEPFDSKTFEVKPGTYTIKGWRKGYQEEVMQITIKPGTRPEPITLVATNKL